MQTIQTANQLRGRASGAIFCAGFGALWLALSLYFMQRLDAATISAVALGLATLLATAIYLFREAKLWPSVPDDPAVGRAFAWINAIQWLVVFVAASVLARLRLYAYIPSAITAIVGLHMFPLGRIFHYPQHYRSGAIMTAWAVVSAIFIPVEYLPSTAAFGTGLLLWFSAVVTLALALRDARQSVVAQPS
ncbi:MAG: hypothetical protein ABR906_04220 [Terracidiphilus sp.]|jgi:hypothetical protein